MQEKIQVKNIFLWLKIIPLYNHLYSTSMSSSHRHPLLSLLWHATAVFQSSSYGAYWVAATKMNSGTVKPCSINLLKVVFSLGISDTYTFLQILYSQTFCRNQHFVVDIQG